MKANIYINNEVGHFAYMLYILMLYPVQAFSVMRNPRRDALYAVIFKLLNVKNML